MNTRTYCTACEGTGVIVTIEPAPIKGCKLTSTVHTCEMRRFCETCTGTGKGKAAPAAAPQPAGVIAVAGRTIAAPGFTPESFDRAVHRAFCEGLRIEPTDTAGVYLVSNPTHATAYAATRETCTCPAGTAGRACKHRARVAFELDLCEGRYLPAPAIIGEAA